MAAKERALRQFAEHHGMLRTAHALRLGIHPRTLYALRKEGQIVSVARGLYRIADAPELSDPDMAIVAAKIPSAVVCLLSALNFHNLTTQIPHQVYVALPRHTTYPRLEHPPLRIFQFSKASYEAGIETKRIEGVELKVYCPAKTVVDCFKFRNQVGLDVALEALRDAWRHKRVTMDDLWRFAQVCRVTNVMRPYLESIA
jgi:predicted transcriptional regulator of viral defense system